MTKWLWMVLLVGCASIEPAKQEEASVSSCLGQSDGVACGGECTTGGTCRDGRCVGAAPQPEGTSCASGDLCSGGATCDGQGQCLPGPPIDCDDGDPCTADSCVEEAGCLHVPICQTDAGVPPPDAAPARPDARVPSTETEARPVEPYYQGGACSIGHRGSAGGAIVVVLFLVWTRRTARRRR